MRIFEKILNYWFTLEFLSQDSYPDLLKLIAPSWERNNHYLSSNLHEKIRKQKSVTYENNFRLSDFLPENYDYLTWVKEICQSWNKTTWGHFTLYGGRVKREFLLRAMDKQRNVPERNEEWLALFSLQLEPNFELTKTEIGNRKTHISLSPILWACSKLYDKSVSQKMFDADSNELAENLKKIINKNAYDKDVNDLSEWFEEELNAYIKGSIINIESDTKIVSENAVPTSLLKKLHNKIVSDYLRIIMYHMKDIDDFSEESNYYKEEYYITFKLFQDEKNKEIYYTNDYLGLKNDYYSDDLGLVLNYFYINGTKGITDLINYVEVAIPKNRLDLLQEIESEKVIMQPINGSLGKWPSKYKLANMQQVAVNLALNREEMKFANDISYSKVFSVNGPPGTGKTTLLKEIVANNIVQRASILSKYEDADDAFEIYETILVEDKPQCVKTSLFKLKDDELRKFGIVVASSNNAAVENISKELPKVLVDFSIKEEDKKGFSNEHNKLLEDIQKLFDIDYQTKLYVVKNIMEKPFKELKIFLKTLEKKNYYRLSAIKDIVDLTALRKFIDDEEYNHQKGREQFFINNKQSELCFDDVKTLDNIPDLYFSSYAHNWLHQDKEEHEYNDKLFDTWAFISAALGKKSNIKNYDGSILSHLVFATMDNNAPLRYDKSRERFIRQKQLVDNLKNQLDNRVKTINRLIDIIRVEKDNLFKLDSKIKDKQKNFIQLESSCKVILQNLNKEESDYREKVKKFKISIQKCKNVVIDSHNACNVIKEERNRCKLTIDIESQHISFLSKFFKTKKYKSIQERIIKCEEKIQEMNREWVCYVNKEVRYGRTQQKLEEKKANYIKKKGERIKVWKQRLNEIQEKIKSEKNELELLCQSKKSKEDNIKSSEDKIHTLKTSRFNETDGFVQDLDEIKLIDEEYCKELQNRKAEAHVDNRLNTERINLESQKLFGLALEFQREFVLSSKILKSNISYLRFLWNCYKFTSQSFCEEVEKRRTSFMPFCFDTLFLITPVISTTFASIGRMFKDCIKPNTIGTLIIDEAGQAPPQYAVGALFRCMNAIVVGDPEQIEPVVTDGLDILKKMYVGEPYINYDPTYEKYQLKSISVQTFADKINPYGTYLGKDRDKLKWIGCPLVIHRRCISPMFDISNELSYENSMIQQTKSPSGKDFVFEHSCWIDIRGHERGNKNHYVKEQGEASLKILEKAKGSIYIISPFKTVASDMVKQSLFNRKSSIGTIHTFQGKEADEVVLLLGCDHNSIGAVQWVNNNIINVAVSRAKYRLYVIGDWDLWKQSPQLKVVQKYLERNRISEEVFNAMLT